jgi:hypothetical protein
LLALGGLAGGFVLPEIIEQVNAMRLGTTARPSVVSVEGATTSFKDSH